MQKMAYIGNCMEQYVTICNWDQMLISGAAVIERIRSNGFIHLREQTEIELG